MFKKYFNTHLNKNLESNFLEYPKSYLHDACERLEDIQEIFETDVLAKHYYLSKDCNICKELPRLISKDITLEAILLYRISRFLFKKDISNPLLPYLATLMRIRTGMEIYYSTEIGSGFTIQHGVGIVIGPRNVIGKNFSIYQNVTIGQRHRFTPEQNAIIGNDVTLFAGAKILGEVEIGDNVQVGANSVVTSNLRSNTTYVGIPARKLVK